jgi:hypothetical protein
LGFIRLRYARGVPFFGPTSKIAAAKSNIAQMTIAQMTEVLRAQEDGSGIPIPRKISRVENNEIVKLSSSDCGILAYPEIPAAEGPDQMTLRQGDHCG